jgi:hypothetical protein
MINEFEAVGGMRISLRPSRETEVFRGNPAVTLQTPQISHDLARDRTRVAAVANTMCVSNKT